MSNRMNQVMRWPVAAALAALVVAGAGSPRTARAQSKENCNEDDNAQSGDKGKKKNYRTVIGPDGRKVFVIEKAFIVCGKVPKPTVIYALQASTINYEWENLTQDFLPKVIEATRKAPF